LTTSQPRFKDENFDQNVSAAEKLGEFAKKKGYIAAQLALAWLHNKGNDVFQIPETKTQKRIEENAKAGIIKLTPEEIKRLKQ
jgi:aryl-alcohol dehydrogenase-like predicted oxidoreductase